MYRYICIICPSLSLSINTWLHVSNVIFPLPEWMNEDLLPTLVQYEISFPPKL